MIWLFFRSFICEIDNCGSIFSDLSSLESHEKELHNITLIDVYPVDDEKDALDSFDNGISVIKLDNEDSSVTILRDETLYFKQGADIRCVFCFCSNRNTKYRCEIYILTTLFFCIFKVSWKIMQRI